jgi:gluconokinase
VIACDRCVVGVDIGTSSTKAVVFDGDGKVKGRHTVGYPLQTPELGVAEEDPDQIYAAVLTAIRGTIRDAGIPPERIRCVGFSAAMHSLIAVSRDGIPLTPSITWADLRSADWADKLLAELNGHSIYLRTGTPIHPMSPLCKLLWLRHERPDLFAAADRFVGIKEYVFFRLFGQWVVDYSIASATGLFNLTALDWDAEALSVAGINQSRLSRLVPPTHSLIGLDRSLAEDLGVKAQTPFVVGANDGVLSNLGVNAVGPGDVAITIGTSGAMRALVGEPLTDPDGRTFCYLLTDQNWVVGGPVNNGGIVLRWVRDVLAAAETESAKRLGIDAYDVLTRLAEQAAPGCEGLLFHPFLTGERAPWWNARLRASYFGLGVHHRKEHMIRAALEGVIFNLHSILPAVEALIGPTRAIKATGGFARSALWRQMMADVFDREVIVPESFESSCLGAAILGLYAMGDIDSFAVVADMVGATNHHRPIPENVAVYRQLTPIYRSLPTKLADEYAALAQFQRRASGAQAQPMLPP